MENYMMINGVKILLTDDQVKMMRSAPNKQSPFERREEKDYYFIGPDGKIHSDTDWGAPVRIFPAMRMQIIVSMKS